MTGGWGDVAGSVPLASSSWSVSRHPGGRRWRLYGGTQRNADFSVEVTRAGIAGSTDERRHGLFSSSRRLPLRSPDSS